MHKIFFCNKFVICLYMFRALCTHHQKVKLVLYSVWYHHTYRWPSGAQVESYLNVCTGRPSTECDDARCCIIKFDLLMMSTKCSKHVEPYNKPIIKKMILCLKLVNY